MCSNFYNKDVCIKKLFGYDIEVRGVGYIISSDKYQYFYKKDKSIDVYKIEHGNLIEDPSIIVDSCKINSLIKCFKSLNIQKLNGCVDNPNLVEMIIDDDTFVYYVKNFNNLTLGQKRWLMMTQKCSKNIFHKTFSTKENRFTFWESDDLDMR